MRKRGVPETKITGDASNREKWTALAEVFPDLAGNPTYEWVHLDLKRRFGIEKTINAETADEIWEETKAQLQSDAMRPQQVLRDMDVEVLCSSDDPTDRLEYHERAEDEVEGVDVRPTWRPDRALKIETDAWGAFVDELDEVTEGDVSDLVGFRAAPGRPTTTSPTTAASPATSAPGRTLSRGPSAATGRQTSTTARNAGRTSPSGRSGTGRPTHWSSSAN